ncbi:MerR family transcriptional regulator [Ramlibacter sp. WS9]|uniref:MerR family transcriptional regulator n=1 Tax=Ramlibacter sp. WS9 TaxID=1882741 RepID=UPI001141F5DB|nr:MerR family transcriptional regulator [Ramlibacter sp. WS9]ROZ62731.1 MerR family transcriptional regulator [Ramlibacter sp. WS9]
MSKQPPSVAAKTPPQLRIGELARLSGRSVHTIRWYEAQGLMPGAARDAGGRRVFNQLHVDWLELMHRLRASGMSIRQMQVYARQVRAGKSTLTARQQLLREHRAQVEAQVQELRDALALIDKKVQLYDKWIKRHAGVPQETL